MKKSREFDNILDECLERLLAQGETVEQCLQSFPGYAEELRPLLETALATKKASAIQPLPEFREKARYQFYAALQDLERKRSRSFFSWQPRWVVAVAIILVLFLAGGGTVAGATGSMPDEPLYPVKLATEQVRVALTTSSLGKAELYAKLAEKRVHEIIRMADEDKSEQIEKTAQRLDDYLGKIADLAANQKAADAVAMAPMLEKAPAAPREEEAEIAPLPAEEPEPMAPPAAGEEAGAKEEEAAEEPVKEAPRAREALTAEKALGAQRAPTAREAQAKEAEKARIVAERRAELKATVVRYAMEHPAQLRALLQRVSPETRQALLRAISDSENGYESIIRSLEEP